MTPDQYRREGAEAMRAAAAHQADRDHRRYMVAKGRDPEDYVSELSRTRDSIRAIDVDEVLAGMPPAPDALAQMVRHADRFLPVFLATAARNIDFDGPWDEIDLSGGLRSLIAAMETSHD